MTLAFSDALRLNQMGFLTGSVKAMEDSPDFEKAFKNLLFVISWVVVGFPKVRASLDKKH